MHQERENLDIIFRKTTPESVLRELKEQKKRKAYDDGRVVSYSEEDYLRIAYGVCPEYSEDELKYRYDSITEQSREKGIFSLLYLYAENVLAKRDGKIAVKLEEVLNWNSITKRLGQDLFTTAWLAYRDGNNNYGEEKHQFIWPAVIITDDVRLNNMLKKGTAENHFHLNGSTQSFSLSWASLMNHPGQIEMLLAEEKRFEVNRDMHISRGTGDNVISWKERIMYAAMIRGLLFRRMMSETDPYFDGDPEGEFKKFCKFPMIRQIDIVVSALRKMYGVCFEQPNYKKKCLDYAISRGFYDVQEEADNRLLSGERAFLYNCFVRIYQEQNPKCFSLFEQKMFYLYLLIKHQFRSELIQVNHRVGFYNFARYQERKSQLFEKYKEYNVEAQRLAVVAARKENYIKSFETRIMVLQSEKQLRGYIEELDEQIDFSDKKTPSDKKIPFDKKISPDKKSSFDNYYVLHFPKKAFDNQAIKKEGKLIIYPRNVVSRKRAELGARELRKYIIREQGREQRVYGIDACSNEIGCRPETFATEFRYLRHVSELRYKIPWYRTAVKCYEELGLTYHAGEDFLDITDGIRAIDEAINFLELQKNDRLGHAIALGICPEEYYMQKNMTIYQSQQDRLDDLVWLLYRSVEWDIAISADHREEMKCDARALISDIYANRQDEINSNLHGDILDAYYASWQLRGDHPRQYESGAFREIKKLRQDPYEEFMTPKVGNAKLRKFREDKLTASLYYWYHYDVEVKKKALKPIHFSVKKRYVDLVREMQKALRRQIAQRGIAIECNPTSNVLISNFKYFIKHPAIVFNHYHLDDRQDEPNLWISINTDDIGVFDTSLSYEYALLFRAITMQRHSEDNWNDEAVYEYLDMLRQNGHEMAFRDVTENN